MELGEDWARADRIARELAQNTDRNELGKVISFFQRNKDKTKFLKLLERLPASGYVRSKQTQNYFAQIRDVCTRELDKVPAERAIEILAWAFRRMTYYQTRAAQRTAQTRGQGGARNDNWRRGR